MLAFARVGLAVGVEVVPDAKGALGSLHTPEQFRQLVVVGLKHDGISEILVGKEKPCNRVIGCLRVTEQREVRTINSRS
jgi:hypothetical protein